VPPPCGAHAAGGAPRPGLRLYLGGVGAEQEQEQQQQKAGKYMRDDGGAPSDAPLDNGASAWTPHQFGTRLGGRQVRRDWRPALLGMVQGIGDVPS